MKKSIINSLVAILSFMSALVIGAMTSSKLAGFSLVALFLIIGLFFVQRANKYYKLEPGYIELTTNQKKSNNVRMWVMVIGGVVLGLGLLLKNYDLTH